MAGEGKDLSLALLEHSQTARGLRIAQEACTHLRTPHISSCAAWVYCTGTQGPEHKGQSRVALPASQPGPARRKKRTKKKEEALGPEPAAPAGWRWGRCAGCAWRRGGAAWGCCPAAGGAPSRQAPQTRSRCTSGAGPRPGPSPAGGLRWGERGVGRGRRRELAWGRAVLRRRLARGCSGRCHAANGVSGSREQKAVHAQ